MSRRITSSAELKKRIVENLDGMPAQQQVAADYLMAHLSDVPFLSVPELARRSGASEATIVRLAQRLGYGGFSDLKADLLEALRQQVKTGPAEGEEVAADPAVESDALAAVARQELENIRRSAAALDGEEFRAAATALFKADHVFTFGLGISAHIADLFTYLLTQIGVRASTLSTAYSSPLEQLGPLRPPDLLVVVSLPPYSKETLEMVAEAANRGIPSLAICDRVTADVSKQATRVLTVCTENMLFTNSCSALVFLLNALVTEIAVRYRGHTVEALARITDVLERSGRTIDVPR